MEGVLSPEMNRLAGRAMHDYEMLADGDRVLVAVSGGIDSLVLVWLLTFWQRKAPITYEIIAIHIDMDPESSAAGGTAFVVQEQLAAFNIALEVVPSFWRPPDIKDGAEAESSNICFQCSSSRRKQLFRFCPSGELQQNSLRSSSG